MGTQLLTFQIDEKRPWLNRWKTLEALLGKWHYREPDIFAIHLSLEEAGVNGQKHGNGGDPTLPVTIRVVVGRWRFWAQVVDQGSGFNPELVPDPTTPEALKNPSPVGRGLFLMRSYMTTVSYNRRGNCVTLRYGHSRLWRWWYRLLRWTSARLGAIPDTPPLPRPSETAQRIHMQMLLSINV